MRWHRAFVVSGLIFASGCPDKNDPARRMRVTVARFEAFTEDICRCKDKACADNVQKQMSTWASEMANESPNTKGDVPDEATMKKTTELAQRYSECVTKAIGVDPEIAAPAPRDDVPPASTSRDADALVRDVKTWARAKQPEHFATDIVLEYVDANGELDTEHGHVGVMFGRVVAKPDDPKRKLGAPVPPKKDVADCFQVSWSPQKGWDRTPYGCAEAFDVTNRCSATQVWRKALERNAPETALATLRFRTASAGGSWVFTISDEPRDIRIVESFTDDCPLAVEQ
ncbi:MAG: hypothetical protein ACKV2T_42615 [Kofleriaceae bacterium]